MRSTALPDCQTPSAAVVVASDAGNYSDWVVAGADHAVAGEAVIPRAESALAGSDGAAGRSSPSSLLSSCPMMSAVAGAGPVAVWADPDPKRVCAERTLYRPLDRLVSAGWRDPLFRSIKIIAANVKHLR